MAKRCEIEPRLLLITNRKSHIGFQLTCKSLTVDDLEGHYCNGNCIGCSASSLATTGFSCRNSFMVTFCNKQFEIM